MGEYGAQVVWKRLLWKEYREGRLVVLFALLAPLVLFRVALAYPEWSFWRPMLALPAAVGVHLLLAFWGAGRGNSKRSGSEFSWTHLPTSPVTEWMASMVVPVVVIGLVGAWYGWLASPAARAQDDFSIPLAGALDLTTTFVICYFISMVISNWAAYLFGAFRLIGGTLISVWGLTPMVEADVVGFVSRTFAGAALGTLVYVAPFRKKSVAYRQGMALCALLVVIFGPFVPEVVNKLAPVPKAIGAVYKTFRTDGDALKTWRAGGDLASYFANSRNGIVEVRPARPHLKKQVRMVVSNRRTNFSRARYFSLGKSFFYVGNDDRVYLAQRAKEKPGLEIVEWEPHADKLRTVGRLPVGPGQFEILGRLTSVSPDAKYMTIEVRSSFGRAMDLWVVDFASGRARIAVPDIGFANHGRTAVWQKGSVVVWDRADGAIVIDLKTLAVKPIRFEEVSSR